MSDYFVSRLSKSGHRLVKVLLLNKDIVRIICGYGKYTYLVIREYPGDLREYPDERKIEYAFDAKALPAVIALCRILGCIFGLTDQRVLLIGLPDKVKIAYGNIFVFRLANRKIVRDLLRTRFIIHSSL